MANKIALYDVRWIDIVFNNRNKAYGAYQIRKEYNRNILAGIFSSSSLFVVLYSLTLFPKEKINAVDIHDTVVIIDDIFLPAKADAPKIITLVRPSGPIPPEIRRNVFVISPEEVDPGEAPVEDPQHGNGTPNDGGTNPGEAPAEGGGGGGGIPADLPVEDHKPMLLVDQMPLFPGGEEALLKYIKNNINYPLSARNNNIQGTIYVSFVVGRTGEVEDVKILKGIGKECDEAAMKVVRSLPKFEPGKQNGKAVRVQYNIPIKFTIG
jgi:periplasmic protein TonB